MTTRAVPISRDQAALIEREGMELMRRGEHERATGLLAIVLAWKVAPVLEFACDIDESAGMAEIVHLHVTHSSDNWSRKVSS